VITDDIETFQIGFFRGGELVFVYDSIQTRLADAYIDLLCLSVETYPIICSWQKIDTSAIIGIDTGVVFALVVIVFMDVYVFGNEFEYEDVAAGGVIQLYFDGGFVVFENEYALAGYGEIGGGCRGCHLWSVGGWILSRIVFMYFWQNL